jgi:hypothetical protein
MDEAYVAYLEAFTYNEPAILFLGKRLIRELIRFFASEANENRSILLGDGTFSASNGNHSGMASSRLRRVSHAFLPPPRRRGRNSKRFPVLRHGSPRDLDAIGLQQADDAVI